MVVGIREIEAALGSANKRPAPSELKNLGAARRSLVTARAVKCGETFTLENLAVKRPGNGIAPIHFWDWLGKPATRDYSADELIE